jgi:hypothetical protein
LKTLLIVCFILIATAFFESFVGKWGELLYEFLTK